MLEKQSGLRSEISGLAALVTGGTRGIGLAIAKSLLEAGAKVAICGRTEEHLKDALDILQPLGIVYGVRLDVSKQPEAERFVQEASNRLGDVGILVNNAGSGTFRSVADLHPEEWDQMIALNLSGPFYCSKAVLPLFRKRGGGYIINISSLAGKNAFAGGAGYNASKFGLNGFSEALMLDHRQEGVRVSYVMPGSVDTGFGGTAGGSEWKIAPEDVAAVVRMLVTMPARTLVSRVEIRPSRPPVKS